MSKSTDIFECRKAQIFISYTTDDRPLVANFIERLTDEAIAAAAVVWYDRKIIPARDWDDEIMTRLHSADIILVLASPKFFKSRYVAERELPVMRGRLEGTIRPWPASFFQQPPIGTVVRVIRLREFDEPRPEIEGLSIWPDGDRTVQTVAPDGSEMRELRTWLKVEICKALVARHADRYDHRSREEEIQRRNEDLDPLGNEWRVDDLTYLHEQLGVHIASGARQTAGGIGGVVVGVVAGLATKAWLLPGTMTSIFGPIVFFAIVGFIAGMVKPVFRNIEMMLEFRHGKKHGLTVLTVLGMAVLFLPLVVFAGLFFAIVSGVIFGLPIGALLSIGGWNLDIGLVGAAAIGGMMCGIAGLDFGSSFTSKRLKVFTDVCHLYQPPVVEPLPPLLGCDPQKPAKTPLVGGESPATILTPSPTPIPPCEPEPSTNDPSFKSESDPDDSYKFPKSPVDVSAKLTVVTAAGRSEEASQLLTALQANFCDDVFRITIVTDAEAGVDDPGYWKEVLAREGRCLVLMTAELVQTPLPATIARALAGRSSRRKVYPVLVDADLPAGIPLMNYQGLPTGQLPIRKWPVPENAWVNVSRTVLADEIDEFFARLNLYLGHGLKTARFPVEEKPARPTVEQNFPSDTSEEPEESESAPKLTGLLTKMTGFFEATVRSYYRKRLMIGEMFVDPRYDFSHYPFRHRAWFASPWGAVWWAAAGLVCLGAIGNAIAPQFAPSAVWGLGRVVRHIFPAFALVIAFAYLTLRETLSYVKLRKVPTSHNEGFDTVIGFLLDIVFQILDFEAWTTILVRTARLLARPLILLAAVTATAVALVAPGQTFGHAAGAAVGLACYLVSRYRVPAIVAYFPATIPSPHDMRKIRRGLTWTFRNSRENHPEIERARIGTFKSPLPLLIEGYFEEHTFSMWMVFRGLLDTGWITVAGAATFAGLLRIGLHPLLAFWFALYLMSLVIRLLKHRPKIYRENDQSWLSAVWSAYRYSVLGAIRIQTLLYFTLIASWMVGYFIMADGETASWLSAGVMALVVFSARLFDQFGMTSRAGHSELMTESVLRPIADSVKPDEDSPPD